MKKSERNQNRAFLKYQNGKYHNDKGPLIVDFYGELDTMSKILIEADQEHGIKFVDDIV